MPQLRQPVQGTELPLLGDATQRGKIAPASSRNSGPDSKFRICRSGDHGRAFLSGTVGVPYPVEIRGRYGTWIGFNWSVASGALPPGLLLTEGPEPFESAIISGSPTTAGSYTFTLKLVDARTATTTE